jgi:hypothetical protein
MGTFTISDRELVLGFLLFVPPAWVSGGGALLYVGARFFAGKSDVSYVACIGLHLGAHFASLLFFLTFLLGLSGILMIFPRAALPLFRLGMLLSVAVVPGFIAHRLNLSFWKGVLAWLPTLVPWLMALSVAGLLSML